MNQQEENHELKFAQLKAKFRKIGVNKMPSEMILSLMPKDLKGVEAVKWAKDASNVWNPRSSKHEMFLPIFEKAFDILQDTEVIEN